MLFANVSGQKVEAKPHTKGTCQLCEQPVFSKCGEVNIWHWAHHKVENCDSWYESETAWHKNWKLVFGKEHSEITISKDGVRHIADIQTGENVIIELQNSPIQKPVIRQREIFYGERMIWIINGKPFTDNFQYYLTRSTQLDDDDEYYHRYNPLAGKDSKPRRDEFSFSWSRCRKSWTNAQRQVFIDFGGEHLFRVDAGMGTTGGKGKPISKESFIKKYGGDTELLERLIDKTSKLP